jgi:hypothetical protein
MELKLSSSAFAEGGMIPRKYTCDGPDVSPAIAWEGAPVGTKSLALLCDDPDAPVGNWIHWVIYNIPAQTKGLSEGVPANKELADGTRQGINDFRNIGYGGPCPPRGTHRYVFQLYALDLLLPLEAGVSKAQLLKAMAGHILATAKLTGKYQR